MVVLLGYIVARDNKVDEINLLKLYRTINDRLQDSNVINYYYKY